MNARTKPKANNLLIFCIGFFYLFRNGLGKQTRNNIRPSRKKVYAVLTWNVMCDILNVLLISF